MSHSRLAKKVTRADLYVVFPVIIRGILGSLLKSLNKSHVPEGITTKKLEEIVEQIVGTDRITFNEDELTLEGTWHIKSLHITVGCKGMIIQEFSTIIGMP